jgi:hypothetical protein
MERVGSLTKEVREWERERDVENGSVSHGVI